MNNTHNSDHRVEDDSTEAKFRRIAIWIILAMMTIVCASVFYAFVAHGNVEELWIKIAKEHFAAVVGLPSAALASLCIVLVLRVSSGPLEFEAWGLKFRGAAAPIVFWVICYFTIVVSIRMLWSI